MQYGATETAAPYRHLGQRLIATAHPCRGAPETPATTGRGLRRLQVAGRLLAGATIGALDQAQLVLMRGSADVVKQQACFLADHGQSIRAASNVPSGCFTMTNVYG